MSDKPPKPILELTAQIVSAHAANNEVGSEQLMSLIRTVYKSLTSADKVEAEPAAQEPAVPVKKSVFPDYIICLEDGKRLKTLKRHLNNSFNMTPDDYRRKWKLPRDYPMVASVYAAQRSTLAKQAGLGRPRANEPVQPAVTRLPAKRARGAKG